MSELGKWMFIFGLVLAGLGLVFWSGFGRAWIGRLPGDIHYVRGNFSFHFPLTTCILLSFLLSIVLWLISRK